MEQKEKIALNIKFDTYFNVMPTYKSEIALIVYSNKDPIISLDEFKKIVEAMNKQTPIEGEPDIITETIKQLLDMLSEQKNENFNKVKFFKSYIIFTSKLGSSPEIQKYYYIDKCKQDFEKKFMNIILGVHEEQPTYETYIKISDDITLSHFTNILTSYKLGVSDIENILNDEILFSDTSITENMKMTLKTYIYDQIKPNFDFEALSLQSVAASKDQGL